MNELIPASSDLTKLSQNPEIVFYQPDETIRLEVRMEDDTVWLNRNQLSTLFGRDVKTIGKHINNALQEELKGVSTVAQFATVQKEGDRNVVRNIEYYNLDTILSVGYRVKSPKGILFRQWANTVLKKYLHSKESKTSRLQDIELRLSHIEIAHHQLADEIHKALPQTEGILFEGQIFDAYVISSKLIKSAKERVVLIDNYIDETVLTLLDKRADGVNATIYTQRISQQLQLDIDRHNAQYQPIEVKILTGVHDRFLVVDSTLYHIGASLKDLGKKLFAFCKMEMAAEELLSRL